MRWFNDITSDPLITRVLASSLPIGQLPDNRAVKCSLWLVAYIAIQKKYTNKTVAAYQVLPCFPFDFELNQHA